MEVVLKHPFTMIIAGPTGCGKTFWTLLNLCANSSSVSDVVPKRITYYYGSNWQPIFSNYTDKVRFVKGLPDPEVFKCPHKEPQWIIIDDLMTEASDSKNISDLFVKDSHHENISVILLVQNLFVRGKEFRTISLNAQYLVLFKNPRDRSIIYSLGRQVYPQAVSFLYEAYVDATKGQAFSYLFIDLKPDTPEELRVLSNLFNENGPNIIAYSPI